MHRIGLSGGPLRDLSCAGVLAITNAASPCSNDLEAKTSRLAGKRLVVLSGQALAGATESSGASLPRATVVLPCPTKPDSKPH